jgi:hypothetical protein
VFVAVRRAQHLDEAGQPRRVLAEPVDDLLERNGIDLHSRLGEVRLVPVDEFAPSLRCRRFVRGRTVLLQRIGERLREPAGGRDDEMRRR